MVAPPLDLIHPSQAGVAMRFLQFSLVVLITAMTLPTATRADEVTDASAAVVRVLSFSDDGDGVSISSGTGFAVAPRLIVTNSHVVANANYSAARYGISIVPSRAAKPIKGRIVAFDGDKDLALIRLMDGSVAATTAIYSGVLSDGVNVIALGYPGSVDLVTDTSMLRARAPVRTMGVFSLMERTNGIRTITHTAQINSGNSGGPLMDECGHVIGVNTFITSHNSEGTAYGFAISASELLAFLRRNDVTVNAIGETCVPETVRKSLEAADKAKAELEVERRRSEEKLARYQRQVEQQRHAENQIQAERENYFAIAVLLFMFAAGAGGLAFHYREKDHNPIAPKLAVVAVLLGIGAVMVFLARPTLDELPILDDAAPPNGSPQPTVTPSEISSEVDGKQTRSSEIRMASAYNCSLDQGRSSYNSVEDGPVPLSIDGLGCVNSRTQYAKVGENVWQRVFVLNSEDIVERMTLDATNHSFVRERWHGSAAVAADARRIRDLGIPKTCASDVDVLQGQVDVQEELIASMTSDPEERLVYKCVRE